MAELALQLPPEPQLSHPQPIERRGAARTPVSFAVLLDRAGHPPAAAQALNVSASGLLVRVDGEPPIWSRLTVELPALGARDARVVRRDRDSYGCLFHEPLEPEELDALLASPEAQAGFDRLRAEAAAPPPPQRRGLLKLWKREGRGGRA